MLDVVASSAQWESCPVYTPGIEPLIPLMNCPVVEANVTTAECATVQVPLSYTDGGDETIGYFIVKRVHAPKEAAGKG